MSLPQPLQGKVALVTGSSRGIGRAIALELARRGADVAVTFFTSREDGQKVAAEIEALGRRTWLTRLNLNKDTSYGSVIAGCVEALGRIDILVANAALGKLGSMKDMDQKGWERTFEVNGWAFLELARQAAERMSSGGRILAITSHGSTRVLPGYGLMGAAKAHLESLVRYLAAELAPRGINVNALSPGLTDTQSLSFFPMRETMLEVTLAKTPLGRIGTAEDVARVAAWMAGPDSAWLVGQILAVDGGYSLVQ